MNVFFEPWIGQNYKSSDKKLLVVGDSHYCGGCGGKITDRCGVHGNCTFEYMKEINCENFKVFTNKVVKLYLAYMNGTGPKYSWMGNTYLPFDRIYFGHEDVTGEESSKLWNSIAFYQFLQTAWSGETSNTTYQDEDYTDSTPLMVEVLETLRPDYMIVWGNRAWWGTPGKPLEWHYGADRFTGYYKLKDGHIIHCMRMYHPSRAGHVRWHEEIKNFLSEK